MANINYLPNEMLAEIFGWLPLKDKTNARLVCDHWSYVMEEAYLKFPKIVFRYKDDDEKCKVIQALCRKGVLIHSLRLDLFRFIYTEEGFRHSSVKELVIRRFEDRGTPSQEETDMYEANMSRLLKEMKYASLSTLRIDLPDVNISTRHIFASVNLPCLTRLELYNEPYMFDPKKMDSAMGLLDNNFPKLATLKFQLDFIGLRIPHFNSEREFSMAFFKFIARHSSTLKNLHTYVVFSLFSYENAPPVESSPNDLIPLSKKARKNLSEKAKKIRKGLEHLQLQTLDWSWVKENDDKTVYVYGEGTGEIDFVRTLLQSQKHLRKLKIYALHEIMDCFMDMVQKNCKTLREIGIGEHWEQKKVNSERDISCSIFRDCRDLEGLEVVGAGGAITGLTDLINLPRSIRKLRIASTFTSVLEILKDGYLAHRILPNLKELEVETLEWQSTWPRGELDVRTLPPVDVILMAHRGLQSIKMLSGYHFVRQYDHKLSIVLSRWGEVMLESGAAADLAPLILRPGTIPTNPPSESCKVFAEIVLLSRMVNP